MAATDMNSIEQLLKLNETLRKYNIGLSVFISIACVETEDLKLTDIGERLGVSSGAMTTIRDTAETNHFIEEVTTEDRRSKFYRITDLGREMLASARQ